NADEEQSESDAFSNRMALGERSVSPNDQRQNEQQRDAACCAVGELDEGLGASRDRQISAVAVGPVAAASCAGAREPDNRTPEDNQHVEAERQPGEAREPHTATR